MSGSKAAGDGPAGGSDLAPATPSRRPAADY